MPMLATSSTKMATDASGHLLRAACGGCGGGDHADGGAGGGGGCPVSLRGATEGPVGDLRKRFSLS